eukprot:351876-Chlamydomonas_euryale.AAC.2
MDWAGKGLTVRGIRAWLLPQWAQLRDSIRRAGGLQPHGLGRAAGCGQAWEDQCENRGERRRDVGASEWWKGDVGRAERAWWHGEHWCWTWLVTWHGTCDGMWHGPVNRRWHGS